ncbi:hypothetical protein J7J26_01525 [Candidatus Micrarchaeota archaeon]|nr:hypothetical protein [Candidatus Micrarchaeota archaeon]
MNGKTITFITLAGGGIALLLAIFTFNVVAISITSVLLFLTFILWKYGYVVMPSVFKMIGLSERFGQYEIPPSQDIIVKKSGQDYYASVFYVAIIPESITEMNTEQRGLFAEYFERAISSVKSIVKFSVLVRNINLSDAIDEIKAKRSWCETKRAQLVASNDSTKEADVMRLNREITMWNRQLERLTSGEKPMEVVCYMMTTAKGTTKEEAIIRAKSQGNEVKSVVGNALNVEVHQLIGEDMKRIFEWETFIPASETEFSNIAL